MKQVLLGFLIHILSIKNMKLKVALEFNDLNSNLI
jgi:hypothetical protein